MTSRSHPISTMVMKTAMMMSIMTSVTIIIASVFRLTLPRDTAQP
jgi:hypothetical protein